MKRREFLFLPALALIPDPGGPDHQSEHPVTPEEAQQGPTFYVNRETGVDAPGYGSEDKPFKSIGYSIIQMQPKGSVIFADKS